MAKMKSDASLDYAVFQLSPKRSRLDISVCNDCFHDRLMFPGVLVIHFEILLPDANCLFRVMEAQRN